MWLISGVLLFLMTKICCAAPDEDQWRFTAAVGQRGDDIQIVELVERLKQKVAEATTVILDQTSRMELDYQSRGVWLRYERDI